MSLLDTASLIVTPNGYKEGKLYSVIPSDGSGDMSVVRATTATRVNSSGLVELVPYNLVQYSEQFDNAWWLKFQANVTADNTTAPNGTTTADKVIASTNGAAVVYRSETYLVSGVYNFSIYAKSGNQDKVYLEAYGVGGTACSTNINLTTQTIISQTNFTNINIENVGNGWFRISATFSNLGGSVVTFGFGMATSVSTNDFAYFWGGQLVEGSTAKDYQKTETRLNIPRLDYSNGTCPSLLVEPQRTNVLQRSQEFENAYWINNGVTITANQTTAPDGTLTADILNGVSGGFGVVRFSTWSATNNAASCFAKKNTSNIFRIANVTGTVGGVNFDLNSGVVSSVSAGFSATIEDFGNGWYRCTAVDTLGRTGTFSLGVTSASESIFIWGAQLESGSYSTSYIPTTSASVTRNADVIFKTGISSLIGSTEGTIFLDYIWNNNASDVIPIAVNGDGGKFIWFRLNGVQFYGNGGSLVFNHSPSNGTYNQRYKLAFVYGQNDFRVYMNGVLVASQTSGTFSGAFNEILFTPIGSTPYNDSTKHNAVALWKTRLTNDQLAQLTTI